MKQSTTYEWDYELSEDGDVVDHHFADRLNQLPGNALDLEKNLELVLVKTVWEGEAGQSIKYREWAYVKDGVLPTHFSDAGGAQGDKVPMSFHADFNSYKSLKASQANSLAVERTMAQVFGE